MDIKLVERGESYYQKLMDDVVSELDSKKLLILEDGRKIMFVPGQTVPLTSTARTPSSAPRLPPDQDAEQTTVEKESPAQSTPEPNELLCFSKSIP